MAIASRAKAPKIRRKQNTRMTIVSRSSSGGTPYTVSVANDCMCMYRFSCMFLTDIETFCTYHNGGDVAVS